MPDTLPQPDTRAAAAADHTLRERITEALTTEHYRRAREQIVASPEEHQAGFAEAVMTVVQPIIDALTERAERAEAAGR